MRSILLACYHVEGSDGEETPKKRDREKMNKSVVISLACDANGNITHCCLYYPFKNCRPNGVVILIHAQTQRPLLHCSAPNAFCGQTFQWN